MCPMGRDPWEDRSKTKQDRFNKQVNTRAADFYENDLVPCLNEELEELLGSGRWVGVDPLDGMVVNFSYPRMFEAEYLRNSVRLEIGPLAEWLPSHRTTVKPFVAEKYPRLFHRPATDVLTIDVERTFWEKLTILHKMAHFPEEKPLPPRYARHLYDVYRMAVSPVKESAFARKELLERDILFKEKFYYAKSAHYETATLQDIRLIPAGHIMKSLRDDYTAMRNMIYGEYPSLDEILLCLAKLEEEIHALGSFKK